MTDGQVLDVIPQQGAERAAGVWAFQRQQGPIMAAARGLLEYFVWLSEQSCEMRMEIAIATERAVRQQIEARVKYRREAQEVIGK